MIGLIGPRAPAGLALDLDLPGTALALDLISDAPGELLAEERGGLSAAAVASRRQEFAAARVLARRAMMALSLPPAAVPRGAGRDPVWPQGTTGSLTHCRDLAAAVISTGLGAVGIDVEDAGRFDAGMLAMVLTPEERGDVVSEPYATALFSAKEAAFKAVNPLTRRPAGFHDAQVTLDLPNGRFTVAYRGADPANAVMERLEGAVGCAQGHVLTLAWLRSVPA